MYTGQVACFFVTLVQQPHIIQQREHLLTHLIVIHALKSAIEPHVLLHRQAGSTVQKQTV